MSDHELRLTHRRRPLVRSMGHAYADSEVEISAASEDLVEAWRELLSRMPNDVYGAVKEAMKGIDR